MIRFLFLKDRISFQFNGFGGPPGAPESNQICKSHLPELMGKKCVRVSFVCFYSQIGQGRGECPVLRLSSAGETKGEEEPLEIKVISG